MKFKNSYTFIKFLKSYFLIFIIVSGIFSMINIYSIINIQRRLINSYESNLDQIYSYLNTNILQIKRLAEIISNDDSIMAYNMINNLYLPHITTSEIAKIKSSSTLLSSIGLVYRSSLYQELNYKIYTDTGRFSITDYCKLQCDSLIDDVTLQSIIQTVDSPRFVALKGPEQLLLYVVPLPNEFIHSSGVLLFKIDTKILFQGFSKKENNVLIADNSGQLLAHKSLLFDSSIDTQNFIYNKDTYKNLIVFNRKLENYGLTVFLTVYKSSFYQSLFNSIVAFLGLLFFVSVFGVCFSFVMARRNFLPIYSLVNKVEAFAESFPTDTNDEMELLYTVFDHLCEERDKFASEMVDERILVRNHLLIALINNNNYPFIKTGYVKDFLEELNNSNGGFCVVAVLIDDYPQLIKTHSIKEIWLIKYALCNMIEGSCNILGFGYAIESAFSNGIVVIIRFLPDKNIEQTTFTVCQQLRQTVKTDLGFTITCAIGSSVQEVTSISSSYNQAVQYAKYRFFFGKDVIITPELACQFEAGRGHSPIELGPIVNNLLCQTKAGNIGDISAAVKQIFSDITIRRNFSTFHIAYFDVLSALNKLVQEGMQVNKDLFFNKLDVFYENQFETVDEAIETLIYFCEELSLSFLHITNEPVGRDIYPRILKFIEENFSDSNLSLPKIAEKVSLNPSYLTRYFKNRSGIPLMQYIDRFRFQKSKELLIETDRSIKDIIERVGYYDEANFLRKFKKSEGISPSQFRNIYKPFEEPLN